MADLIFIKLGGSLITEKLIPRKPRLDMMNRLASEIAQAMEQQPTLRLVLGHGAGSFAHIPAKKYNTRLGVHTSQEWLGFAEVWWEAAALNRLVMDALHDARLPVVALPPSASAIAEDGSVLSWNITPIKEAIHRGLVPVIFGDAIFDTERGGTILSTENLFEHLARCLAPQRILLAGIEDGVWEDYPTCTRLIAEISPENYRQISQYLSGSYATDVTGGMASKVEQSLALTQAIPGLEVLIFSAAKPGRLFDAITDHGSGTIIHG
jgi:isopentenyl phosphate kinase